MFLYPELMMLWLVAQNEWEKRARKNGPEKIKKPF